MSGMDTSIAYDVVLLPDTDRAVAYRKRAADGGCSLMGVTVAAFGAWVRDLWELYGDGRAFVSRLEREALLRAAFEEAVGGASFLAGAGDAGAIGLDRVASACVAAGVGLPGFDAAVRDALQGVPAGVGALEGVTCAEAPVLRLDRKSVV